MEFQSAYLADRKQVDFFFLKQTTTSHWDCSLFEAQISNEPRLAKFTLDLRKMTFSLESATFELSTLANFSPQELSIKD